ncbi:MAG: HIT family protein [Candidatus Competibacteraceae bacterium]|nr:HIT family protein [Candidatus Competibacteraceae bacterium]
MQQANCIFCKIARGEAPCTRVYEDQRTLAFMDIQPASEGHILVVSKEHFETLLEIDEANLTAVSLTVQRVARAIQHTLEPDGIRVAQLNGSAAGQTVFHYHVHLVPLMEGQKAGFHGRGVGDLDKIARIGGKIRSTLENLPPEKPVY